MDKLTIGICDDQKNIVLELNQLIQTIQNEWSCNWDIRLFHSGDELINEISEIDAVFLDIEMPEIDGIEVGRKIKLIKPNCKIIMATGKVDRFKETFKIHAVRFITKPFDKNEVEEALDVVIKMNFGGEIMELFYMRNPYKIPQYMIQYINAYNGYAEFAVDNRILRREISLTDLMILLDKRLFFRINRQHVINLRWISSYDEGNIQINEKIFKVSRRKKKEFEQKYIDYDIKYRWGFE